MDTIDLAISFDTTGSMYPCLTQVRRSIEETVKYLFKEIPTIRIAIMAHGDYCDGKNVLTVLDFTNNQEAICKFVREVKATSGGDADECYEFVLNQARSLTWTGGINKAFVMIGDAEPHRVGYRYNSIKNTLDWKNEVKLLVEAGIHVIPMQALGARCSMPFYEGIASLANSQRLTINQFADINEIIMAIAMSRAAKLPEYEETLKKRGSVSFTVLQAIDTLSGRKVRAKKTTKESKHAVHPARFQILYVDADCCIKDFVEANGLKFKRGRGFYEFTKSEMVQEYKEVIIQDRTTEDMFSGDKARELLGIPVGERARVRPDKLNEYRGFIQSTSNNRKLKAGTSFLYEVEDV